MSSLREFDNFWVQYKSGPTPLTAIIIFQKGSSPVGKAEFWMTNAPLADAVDTGTQTILYYHIDQLQAMLSCLALPGKHRLNYTNPKNAQIDLGYT